MLIFAIATTQYDSNMKTRLTISLILLISISAQSFAFDWKPQSNESLRAEMLSYAQETYTRAKGTPEGRAIHKFIRKVKKTAKSDPYAWADETRALVRHLESMCPPCEDDGSEAAQMRRDILRLIDFPLHLDNFDKNAPEGLPEAFKNVSVTYRAEAREKALQWLDRPNPEPGVMELVKVYNLGYFLRTSERTVAIDVKWEGTAAEAEKIASKVDIFFLSHPHGDHYSNVLMHALSAARKTVVLPSDVVPMDQWDGKIVINDDIIKPIDVCGITMQVIRGDQGQGTPNNGYILAFDGWRLLLQGENSHQKIDERFKDFDAPDLIIAPSWNGIRHLFEVVRDMPGYDSKKVRYIPGHENELNHTVDHRESYRELFTRKDRLGSPEEFYPTVILQDIGESVTLSK